MSKPIVRFAPSPTGYLHIGSARTAMFNWLFAKHTGGKFLLRIEDTDRERSRPEATKALIEGLAWLGLDWDGEPISQFARAERHKEVAYELLERNAAYKCFATAEELKAFREAHPHQKFISPWRDRTDHPDGMAYSIRIKAPLDGQIIEIHDKVQGKVQVNTDELDDMILLRSDGTPTYLLAVVVDDHDMGITHVIRGDDHLTNTFRQILIFKGMDWALPEFAHIPLIHGADGAKLSKRHGALGVHEYEKMGYLPEALFNYLLRLGWSHGDDEIITKNQAIEWFDLDGVNKAPGRLDVKKMEAVNAHYIKEADNDRLLTLVMADAEDRALLAIDEETAIQRLKIGMNDLKSRVKTVLQITDEAHFYLKNSPIDIDEGSSHILKQSSKSLDLLYNLLRNLSDWTSESIEALCKQIAADHFEGKLPEVFKPLRAALTGRTNSPSLPRICVALGKEEVLKRIQSALPV